MGSDDLHHKRKARRERDLARGRSRRNSYDRILIVCEGSKSEKNYLQELCDFLKLNPANVEIDGNSGSSPISVVRYAKRRFSEEGMNGDTYDRVFCVFDRDAHSSYEQAIDECKKSKPVRTFYAIASVPCFEFWLLLHF